MPLYRRNSYASDVSTIVVIDKKKKKKKGFFGKLFGGGGGSKKKSWVDEVVSIRDVTEPGRLIIRKRPSTSSIRTRITIKDDDSDTETVITCQRCRTRHYYTCVALLGPSYEGCCICMDDGRDFCIYQRRRRPRSRRRHYDHDDYYDYYDPPYHYPYRYYTPPHIYYPSSYPHPLHHPSPYSTPPTPWQSYNNHTSQLRSNAYLNSTEHAWREELTDLYAETREESAWERHNRLEVMPDYEKTDFRYKDPDERRERIRHLEHLLEEVRVRGVEGERMGWRGEHGLG
jgi:hypothetical protein